MFVLDLLKPFETDNGDQELFIGTVTSAPPFEDSAWFTNFPIDRIPIREER